MGYYIPDGPAVRPLGTAPSPGRIAAVAQRLRETLKAARLETRVSQTTLARQIKLPGRVAHTRHNISRWETGHLYPTFEDFIALISTLHLTHVELLYVFGPVIDPAKETADE